MGHGPRPNHIYHRSVAQLSARLFLASFTRRVSMARTRMTAQRCTGEEAPRHALGMFGFQTTFRTLLTGSPQEAPKPLKRKASKSNAPPLKKQKSQPLGLAGATTDAARALGWIRLPTSAPMTIPALTHWDKSENVSSVYVAGRHRLSHFLPISFARTVRTADCWSCATPVRAPCARNTSQLSRGLGKIPPSWTRSWTASRFNVPRVGLHESARRTRRRGTRAPNLRTSRT